MSLLSSPVPDTHKRPLCESCEQVAATVDLTWPDLETFHVCTACMPQELVVVEVNESRIEEEV